MTPVDRVEFATGLKGLALRYRGKQLTTEEVDAYWSGLVKHPLSWVLNAMLAAGSLYPRFFPTVGEIEKAGAHADQEAARQRFITPAMNAAIAQGETYCKRCDDTGWIHTERDCTHMSGHYRAGATAKYASPCGCRQGNPLYQARLARTSRQIAVDHS